MSETWRDSSSNNDSCFDNRNDSFHSSGLRISHNAIDNNGLGTQARSSKRSLISSFKGFWRRPGLVGASTLTTVVPTSSKDDSSRAHGSVEVPGQEARATRGRFITRASKVAAWMKGKPKQEGYVPQKDLPDVPTPVVCNW